jgi:hypothetical protein
MSRDDESDSPMRARTDLIDILTCDPENTEIIATIVEAELRGIRDSETTEEMSNALTEAAKKASLDPKARDNVLYWITETSPDARQLILVKTIEQLLSLDQCRPAALDALARVSSEENVSLVMEWVEKNVLTLDQAIYVLLYPDSTAALS